MAKKKKALQQEHKNEKAIARGHDIVCTHPPLFEALCHAVYMQYESMPQKDWAYVTSTGVIYVNQDKKGQPNEWAYVIAHCLLHLGLHHHQPKEQQELWNIACDCYITKFLAELNLVKHQRK